MSPADNLAAIRLSMELYLRNRVLPYFQERFDSRDSASGRPQANEEMQLHLEGLSILGALESMRVVEGAQPELIQHPFVPCRDGVSCYVDGCHQLIDIDTPERRACLQPEAAHIPRAAEPERQIRKPFGLCKHQRFNSECVVCAPSAPEPVEEEGR